MFQTVKNLPAMQETWVWSLSWEDTLEKGMATHSSSLACWVPWTEEPGRLQCTGSDMSEWLPLTLLLLSVSAAGGLALIHFDSSTRTSYKCHLVSFLSADIHSTTGSVRSVAHCLRLLAQQSDLLQSLFLLYAPFKAGSLPFQPWHGLAPYSPV